MSQILQNVAKFQKFQLENLVDFEEGCKTHTYLQKSEPIQPKTSNILPKFAKNRQLGGLGRRLPAIMTSALASSKVRWSAVRPSAFLANFRQNVARFRLYRHQFLQENTRFAAFFKIYKIIKLKFLKFGKSLQISRHLQNFF